MATLQEQIIATAKGQVGVHEAKVNGHWNNDVKYASEVPGLHWANFQPWCCTFVSWVAYKAGAGDLYPSTASCDTAGAWFKTRGRWSEYPAVGAQVFFGVPRDLSHTGVVVAYDADTITTVEGNTNTSGSREGDGVYLKTHQRRDARVIGYGYPAFPGGIKSADPEWTTGFKQGNPVVTPPKPVTSKARRVDLMDWSHHNTGVTLTRVKAAKAAGLQGAYHKVSEGNGFLDQQYAARRRITASAGLPFGGYHFARPGASSGLAQARLFLGAAGVGAGDLTPVLDLEDDGGLTIKRLTAWVGTWVAEVVRVTGTKPLIYTRFDLLDTFGCLVWVPRYNDAMLEPVVPSPWTKWDAWQFSNGVLGLPDHFAGMAGVDLSTFAWKPGKPFTRLLVKAAKPVVKPPVKPTPAPAPVVKPGEALTWISRHANVQGTDPLHDVTAMVDRLCHGASIVRLNELHTKAQQDYRPHGWAGISAGQLAVLWDDEIWRAVSHTVETANKGIGGITPWRGILTVLLEHRAAGKRHEEQVTHVVQHIDVDGLARIKDAITGQNARAKRHFALLAASIVEHGKSAPLHGSGDLNVDWKSERRRAAAHESLTPWFPYSVLRKVSRIVMPRVGGKYQGTHGARAIDWSWRRGAITVTACRTLPRGTSDHNPVQYHVSQP